MSFGRTQRKAAKGRTGRKASATPHMSRSISCRPLLPASLSRLTRGRRQHHAERPYQACKHHHLRRADCLEPHAAGSLLSRGVPRAKISREQGTPFVFIPSTERTVRCREKLFTAASAGVRGFAAQGDADVRVESASSATASDEMAACRGSPPRKQERNRAAVCLSHGPDADPVGVMTLSTATLTILSGPIAWERGYPGAPRGKQTRKSEV